MKVIIVDDEPKAIELLKGYLAKFESFKLLGTFRNGLKALEFIKQHKVDLALMDINMPHISGLSLSKMVEKDTKIIFTTAYAEFAVESYEVQAFDYLLKPITLERFTKSMHRLMNPIKVDESESSNILTIKSGSKFFRLTPDEILYLEKDGNYMTYHSINRKVLARESVAESLAQLPKQFVQVHKSFIINTQKINYVERGKVDIQGVKIPIGMSFSDNLQKML